MIVLLKSIYKGGVSKTTGNVLLANQLAERGYKVLFLDFDPQMSGTRFLTNTRINSTQFEEKNIFEALKRNDLESNILKLKPNIDYVAGCEYINLFETIMERKRIAVGRRHLYFKSLLLPIYQKGLYDFVVMDMSPSKSVLNTAVMTAATHHIITTQSQVLSLEMVQKYLDDIYELQVEHQIESEVIGISVSMNDLTRLSKQVIELVYKHFGDMVFKTITKRKSRIAEYAASGYPGLNTKGMLYKRDVEALSLHNSLTIEILARLQMPISKEMV